MRIVDTPLANPHSQVDAPHYRLYLGPDGPTAICVQWFDYLDYNPAAFISEEAYSSEGEAAAALEAAMVGIRLVATPASAALLARGALTRSQALTAWAAAGR